MVGGRVGRPGMPKVAFAHPGGSPSCDEFGAGNAEKTFAMSSGVRDSILGFLKAGDCVSDVEKNGSSEIAPDPSSVADGGVGDGGV